MRIIVQNPVKVKLNPWAQVLQEKVLSLYCWQPVLLALHTPSIKVDPVIQEGHSNSKLFGQLLNTHVSWIKVKPARHSRHAVPPSGVLLQLKVKQNPLDNLNLGSHLSHIQD